MTFAAVLSGVLAWFSVLISMMAVIFLTIRRCARAIGHPTWSVIEAHYQSNRGRLRNPGDARSWIRAQIDGTYWRGILLVEHILLVLLAMFGPHLFLP